MGSRPFILQDRHFRLFCAAAGNSHICLRSAPPRYAQLSFGVSHLRRIWGSARLLPPRASTSWRSRVCLKPSARVCGDVNDSNSKMFVLTLARRRCFRAVASLSSVRTLLPKKMRVACCPQSRGVAAPVLLRLRQSTRTCSLLGVKFMCFNGSSDTS